MGLDWITNKHSLFDVKIYLENYIGLNMSVVQTSCRMHDIPTNVAYWFFSLVVSPSRFPLYLFSPLIDFPFTGFSLSLIAPFNGFPLYWFYPLYWFSSLLVFFFKSFHLVSPFTGFAWFVLFLVLILSYFWSLVVSCMQNIFNKKKSKKNLWIGTRKCA